MTILGLIGKMGSGKTTLANILIEKYNFTEYTFAKPIKDIGEIFGFSQEQLYGTQSQKLEIHPYWGISGRIFMQKIGQMFREHFKEVIPEMKIQTPFLEIFKSNFKQDCNYVISDVRFKDEAEFIKSLGGVLIKIERNNLSQSSECNSHISETEMESIVFDYKIQNNSSLENLEEKIILYI
jgi:ABC-type glutathione transport system ATPase component